MTQGPLIVRTSSGMAHRHVRRATPGSAVQVATSNPRITDVGYMRNKLKHRGSWNQMGLCHRLSWHLLDFCVTR
eukprot:2563640-Pyramimonas_sp.AAC.1